MCSANIGAEMTAAIILFSDCSISKSRAVDIARKNDWGIGRMTYYDTIVIGAGIGGLTAAALLARAGYRVLAIEGHIEPGGCASSFARNGQICRAGRRRRALYLRCGRDAIRGLWAGRGARLGRPAARHQLAGAAAGAGARGVAARPAGDALGRCALGRRAANSVPGASLGGRALLARAGAHGRYRLALCRAPAAGAAGNICGSAGHERTRSP